MMLLLEKYLSIVMRLIFEVYWNDALTRASF